MNLSAADLGIDIIRDQPEDIAQKVEAAREQIEEKVTDEAEKKLAERLEEGQEPPEVVLAKAGKEHKAKVDDEFVEKNAEEVLEETRQEMKEEEKDVKR
jgi:hypothetical protein